MGEVYHDHLYVSLETDIQLLKLDSSLKKTDGFSYHFRFINIIGIILSRKINVIIDTIGYAVLFFPI